MNQEAIDGTVFHRCQDAQMRPFNLWGPTDATVHRICSCLGPAGLTPQRGFVLLVEDPYATADRVDLIESVRHQRPEVLVVPVEGIHELAAARKPAYSEDETRLAAQREEESRRTDRPARTSAIPVDRDRSTADGVAIVAAALALVDRYVAAARRCRKPENRAARALHAVDALESARAVHAWFELGPAAVVPAYATLAPDLWDEVADRYRELADAAAPPRDPSDADIEALAGLVD